MARRVDQLRSPEFNHPKMVKVETMALRLSVLLLSGLVLTSGCAKGALWKLGYLSPQARQVWAEEEQYAKTWHSMKPEMTAAVERANAGGLAEQQRVANQLATLIEEDHRIMVRLHATELLAQLPADAARRAALVASENPEPDVRIAACQTLASWGDHDSLIGLQKVLGSDTNPDVRVAATRAIGNFEGTQATRALQLALNEESPALQLAAADSLRKTTDQDFGHNIPQWQDYLDKQLPAMGQELSGDIQRVGANREEGERPRVRFLGDLVK